MSNITNLNRDYLIKINVKEATIDVPKMTFWNTDKKTSNMFVQLVINMSTNELISQYVTVQNATDYKITLNVIKPKTNQYRTIEATLLNEEKALFEIDLPDEFTDQVGDYSFEFEVSSKVDSNDESITTSNGTYKVNGSILTNLNQEISPSPDLPILKQLIEQVKSLQGGDLTGYQKKSDNSLETTSKEVVGAINEVNSQFKDIANYSLAVGDDGLLYLSDGKGNLLGNGIDVKKMQEVVSNLVSVFTADFSGATPLASQFYAWENRVYGSAIYDALSNIQCIDNVAHLTSVYDSENSRWKKQMMCTGGLFESDNFICEFEAKLDGKAGSWNNVITYGTGTHWTNGMYSDGVKWPAGGEIDAFEQAGGYSENPNYFKTPTVHYGSGTGSGYSNTHESKRGDSVTFTINEWHKLKFELVNGCVKIWIDDVFIGENDFSDCVVNNNYLYDYKPFLKPQAFYIDGSCADNSDTSNTYDFSIKNFKIFQEKNVECTGLEIYPQMWGKGTELIFPTDAELFFDKIFTPSNVSNKACKWESTNPSVATVCEGYVKTLTEGTTTIKTTCGTITATYELTVNNTTKNIPCVGLELEGESKQLDIDTTASFKTYVYPKFTTDDLQISYSNNGIVTYDGNTLTAIKAGTTTITVDCGAKTVSFEVTVNDLYGSNAILSYTFDNSTIANNLTVENKGSLGSEYNLIVNCLKDYSGGNVLTTPSALTIPTREAGETYLILIDLYDALDRTVQSAIQGTGRVYFTEVENSANQPNIISTHANISSGGNWQQAYNGSPYEKMLDNPCRVALWRDNTGKSYIYSSKDSEEKIISKSSADTYIKNITKIRLEKARINKLDIYYSNKTVDEVKVLVNDYSS